MVATGDSWPLVRGSRKLPGREPSRGSGKLVFLGLGGWCQRERDGRGGGHTRSGSACSTKAPNHETFNWMRELSPTAEACAETGTGLLCHRQVSSVKVRPGTQLRSLSISRSLCISFCACVRVRVGVWVWVCRPLIAKRTHLHFYLSSSFVFLSIAGDRS